MTKRELCIEKIKPFIDKDIIKVLTGIRRSGKEFSSLKKINKYYPKFVISIDEFDISRNGIKHINIINFLLN